MNAIAYNPHTCEFIDPLKGQEDLTRRIIRMVSPANLQDDPLRLLRAYRQAAQLGFTIDPDTHGVIRQMAPLMGQVVAERVHNELIYLLSCPQAGSWIAAAWEDGLLKSWFPSVTVESLARVAGIDSAAATLGKIWPELGWQISRNLLSTLKITSYLATAKLASLLPPETKEAESQLVRLKFSRSEIGAATRVIKGWRMLLAQPAVGEWGVRSQHFLFVKVGPLFPTLAVMAVSAGVTVDAIAPLISRYLTADDQVAHPTPLVNGADVMAALDIPRGPQIGHILAEIQLARIEGQISTPEEALQYAAQLVSSRGIQ